MRSLGLVVGGVLLGALGILWLLPDHGERCETIVAQERAGASIVLAALRDLMEDREAQRAAATLEMIKLVDEVRRAQQEIGSLLAAQVVIPEPEPQRVNEIKELAAYVAPQPALWPQIKQALNKGALLQLLEPAKVGVRGR